MSTKTVAGKNDLATLNPALALEWDYSNNAVTPQQVTCGSSKKVAWTGLCGHHWLATVASRNKGAGCPICARGKNAAKIRNTHIERNGSLLERNPLLAMEWHPSRNGDLMPKDVSPNSHKVVWWLGICGHEWEASVKSRNKGTGCPVCASSVVQTGENDFASSFPQLLMEWDYGKNNILPTELTPGSNYKAWWKCSKGHEWQTAVKVRTNGGNCPFCAGNRLLPGSNDLHTLYPEIAKEWHPSKNGELTPVMIAAGSHKKVWWKCTQGHEWEASPNHRTGSDRNCPYCCANPQLLPGCNDLKTVNPSLAAEWHPIRNSNLRPEDVTAKSSKKVWWKCNKGHEWKTAVNHRANGSGCPYCSGGKQTSFPEQAIYFYVKQAYSSAINGFTEIFHNHGMELDVYIPDLKIGIEYDGLAFHRSQEQKNREANKYRICKENDIYLIRIRENKNDTTGGTYDAVVYTGNHLNETISKLVEYLPDISDVDIDRDEAEIKARYLSDLYENSLAIKRPDLAMEWNYDKNQNLLPENFPYRSNSRVWWKCKFGHEWQAKIDARVRGTGCPYCSNNKILPGYNDLTTKRPDLMKEWHPTKNIIDPTHISSGSGKKAWWICAAGHEWMAEISSRNKGHGCPYCAGNRILN